LGHRFHAIRRDVLQTLLTFPLLSESFLGEDNFYASRTSLRANVFDPTLLFAVDEHDHLGDLKPIVSTALDGFDRGCAFGHDVVHDGHRAPSVLCER
jgi:hypothetical protein